MFQSHCLPDVSIKIQNSQSNQGGGDKIESDCDGGEEPGSIIAQEGQAGNLINKCQRGKAQYGTTRRLPSDANAIKTRKAINAIRRGRETP